MVRHAWTSGLICSRLGVTVLLGHTKVNDVDGIGSFRCRSTNQEVIRFDVSVDQILLMDCLHPRKLRPVSLCLDGKGALTICRAVMQHVLTLNFLEHISNKSSSDGPRRSITRMLCSPSWPK